MPLTLDEIKQSRRIQNQSIKNGSIFQSFVSGAISSGITAIIYQPLELIKTRLQIRDNQKQCNAKVFGRAINSFDHLIETNGVRYLWRGTYPVSSALVNESNYQHEREKQLTNILVIHEHNLYIYIKNLHRYLTLVFT